MTDLQKFLLAAVAGMLLVAGFVASYKIGQRSPVRGDSIDVKVLTDTLVIRDTTVVEKPVFRSMPTNRGK